VGANAGERSAVAEAKPTDFADNRGGPRGRSGRAEPGARRDLASWWRSRPVAGGRRPRRPALCGGIPILETPLPAARSGCCGSCATTSTASRSASSSPTPTAWCSAGYRGRRSRTPPRQGPARPGFSYAEEFVGTNGIAARSRAAGRCPCSGHEHYAEDLEDLACAGVPIHHPISGKNGRRVGPDLLAEGCRTPAHRAGPHDRRPDPAGAARRDRDAGVRPAPGILRACRRSTGSCWR